MGILRASYLKQNIGGNVDIFLQNKRKLTSVVVVCRPCSRKWQILVNIGDFEGLPPNAKTGEEGLFKINFTGVPSSSSPVSPRFFPLFRSLSFSLALRYLNAWNRLTKSLKSHKSANLPGHGVPVLTHSQQKYLVTHRRMHA